MRWSTFFYTFALALTVVDLFCLSSLGHVIGVDFGSKYIKVSGLQNGRNMAIVINEFSNRKTANCICLYRDEWNVGDHANVLAARFPDRSAAAINLLVGKTHGDLQHLRSLQLEFNVFYNSRGAVAVNFSEHFSNMGAEEVYAMFLMYAQKIAANDGIKSPDAAVITLPHHARMKERRAVMNAARLANMSVLRFIDSTTAAALYYGIRKRGFQNTSRQLFVLDIGATGSRAGVFTFLPPKGKSLVMSDSFGTLVTNTVVYDNQLSGRALDLCVAHVMENEAIAKMGIAPVLNVSSTSPDTMKAHFALLRAANVVRERLSANTVTPYTVEGISTGRDFHSSFARATFEAECAPLLQRVQTLVRSVLDAPEVNTTLIQAYEVIGGTSRTPRIIADVSSAIGRNVDRTLNMDEAAATGAGYLAAKLSSFYNIKGFKLVEKLPYSVHFAVHPHRDTSRPPYKRLLFNHTKALGSFTSVSLNRTDDFTISLYEDSDGTSMSTEPSARVVVTGVRSQIEKTLSDQRVMSHPNNSHIVRVQFYLNEGGVLELESAIAVIRYAVSSTGKTSDVLLRNSTVSVSSNASVSGVEKNEGNAERDDNAGQNGGAYSNSTAAESSVSAQEPVIAMHTHKVTLDATLHWLDLPDFSEDEWEIVQTKLQTIEEHERIRRERALARNNLEAYLYWVKNDKYEELRNLSEATDLRGELQKYVAEVQEWLEEGEGSNESCSHDLYVDRLSILQNMVEELLHLKKDELSEGNASANEIADNNSSKSIKDQVVTNDDL